MRAASHKQLVWRAAQHQLNRRWRLSAYLMCFMVKRTAVPIRQNNTAVVSVLTKLGPVEYEVHKYKIKPYSPNLTLCRDVKWRYSCTARIPCAGELSNVSSRWMPARFVSKRLGFLADNACPESTYCYCSRVMCAKLMLDFLSWCW